MKRVAIGWRTVATMLLVAALAIPAVRDGDGVPLSSYSMYARARSDIIEFVVPIGLDATGSDRELSTTTIASTNDPLIAESFLRDEVAAGRVEQLCQQIASRISDTALVAVEIRSERHDVVNRVLGEPSLIEQQVLARCETSQP